MKHRILLLALIVPFSFNIAIADEAHEAKLDREIQKEKVTKKINAQNIAVNKAAIAAIQLKAGPAGAQGVIGLTGAKGATGATGLTGAKGATGAQGVTGAKGATGAQGPIGLTGAKGATGATGAQGLIGLTGAKGATGATGAQGLIGLTGADGAKGSTGAQGVAGAKGATGATGAQGPIGLIGAKGATGAAGAQGPIGLAGAKGATGAAGAQGPIGLAGAKGGAQGPIGLTGAKGATGAAGAQGPIGLTGAKGATGATGAQGLPGTAPTFTSTIMSVSCFSNQDILPLGGGFYPVCLDKPWYNPRPSYATITSSKIHFKQGGIYRVTSVIKGHIATTNATPSIRTHYIVSSPPDPPRPTPTVTHFLNGPMVSVTETTYVNVTPRDTVTFEIQSPFGQFTSFASESSLTLEYMGY